MSIKRFSKFFLTLYLDDIFMSMCALNNTEFSEFQRNSTTNASSSELPWSAAYLSFIYPINSFQQSLKYFLWAQYLASTQ